MAGLVRGWGAMALSNRELVETGKRSLKRSLIQAKGPLEYQKNILEFRKRHEGGLGSDANIG